MSCAVALIGAIVLVGPSVLARSLNAPLASSPADVADFNLPENVSGWIRDGEAPLEESLIEDLGVRNQVWIYRKGDLEAYVALNFPFRGFHDTRLCYTGQGWQFLNQVDGALPGDTARTVRFLQMSQPANLTHANLWLSVLDESGVPQTFASENPMERVTERLLSRWSTAPPMTTTFVVQVLAVEPSEDTTLQSAFTDLLAGTRGWLTNELARRFPNTPKEN